MFNFITKAASTVADMKRLLLLCVLCFPALAGAASCEIADKSLCEAAERGDIKAQSRLGAMYYSGKGVRQNKPLAKEWFGKSCDNGYQVGCDAYRDLYD